MAQQTPSTAVVLSAIGPLARPQMLHGVSDEEMRRICQSLKNTKITKYCLDDLNLKWPGVECCHGTIQTLPKLMELLAHIQAVCESAIFRLTDTDGKALVGEDLTRHRGAMGSVVVTVGVLVKCVWDARTQLFGANAEHATTGEENTPESHFRTLAMAAAVAHKAHFKHHHCLETFTPPSLKIAAALCSLATILESLSMFNETQNIDGWPKRFSDTDAGSFISCALASVANRSFYIPPGQRVRATRVSAIKLAHMQYALTPVDSWWTQNNEYMAVWVPYWKPYIFSKVPDIFNTGDGPTVQHYTAVSVRLLAISVMWVFKEACREAKDKSLDLKHVSHVCNFKTENVHQVLKELQALSNRLGQQGLLRRDGEKNDANETPNIPAMLLGPQIRAIAKMTARVENTQETEVLAQNPVPVVFCMTLVLREALLKVQMWIRNNKGGVSNVTEDKFVLSGFLQAYCSNTPPETTVRSFFDIGDSLAAAYNRVIAELAEAIHYYQSDAAGVALAPTASNAPLTAARAVGNAAYAELAELGEEDSMES